MFFLEFPWVLQVKCVLKSDLNLGLEVWLVEQFENIRLSYKLHVIHLILPWFVITSGCLTIKLVDIVLFVACPNIKDGHNAWVPSQRFFWSFDNVYINTVEKISGWLEQMDVRANKRQGTNQPVVMDVNVETCRKLIRDPTGYLGIVVETVSLLFFFRKMEFLLKGLIALVLF